MAVSRIAVHINRNYWNIPEIGTPVYFISNLVTTFSSENVCSECCTSGRPMAATHKAFICTDSNSTGNQRQGNLVLS